MRFRPASRVVIAGTSLLATWAAGGASAEAQVIVGSPLIPTSTVVSSSTYLPTSYLTTSYLSSSYIPTSTILPTTSIVETGSSVYLPTSYVTSSYYRGGLFRPRRFVERTSYFGSPTGFVSPTTYLAPSSYVTPTSYLSPSYLTPTSYVSSYLPTSYIVPTVSTSSILPTTYLSSSFVTPTSYVVDDGLIATTASVASPCSDSVAPSSPTPTRSLAVPRTTAPTNSGTPITSTPANGGSSAPTNERRPSATTAPTPDDEPFSSNVTPAPASASPPPAPRPNVADPVIPPAQVPADRPEDIKIPPAGGIRPQSDERIERSSYKPSYRPSRNVLRGRVVSFETGRPEESVPVVLANRAGGFSDRKTVTDADGEFKISLPDGDWAVKVTMPSGSIFTVGRGVTASGGRVVDADNREVGELRITR